MKLSVFPRAAEKKSDAKKLRRNGHVPSVLYGVGKTNQNVYFQLDEMQAILRKLRQGLLATTIFELHEGSVTHKAIIKEIQYHPATYAILHVDFALLSDHEPITVNIPIQMVGLADCVGVKLGGFARQVIRSMKVSCLPKDIPQEFQLDIRNLDVAQSMTLSQIAVPAHVRPLAKMNEVAVVIAKKA